MIGERLGGKFKHGCDFWIAYLAFSLPRRAPDLPQVRPGDRPGAMPRWSWPDFDRENHRAPGSPSLQTVREYGRFPS